MRPVDHFFSQAARLESSLRPGSAPEPAAMERLSRNFIALVGPVIGAAAAEELFIRARERLERRGGSLTGLGSLAAFFLGEFDGAAMGLADDDWEDIRETLEEVSGEINMDTLTVLMGDLLARRKI
ncbi:MAG: hypothetical protein LBG10_02295 [Treponema sp.]|jgi:hypothetical protein|nr:hypothetical protein [Treponema sp.]